VPIDWSEVIKSNFTTTNRDVGMQRHDEVASIVSSPRKAYVSDNDDETSAWN